MMTVSEVAKRDGVGQPSVSNRVKKYVAEHGLSVKRNGRGEIAGFDVARYDELRAKFGNPSKDQRGIKPEPVVAPAPIPAQAPTIYRPLAEDDSYEEALRRKTWLDAERRQYDIDAIKRRLVDSRQVAEAIDRAVALILGALDRIEEYADDISAAVGRTGSRGAVAVLKQIKTDLRTEAARALAAEAKSLRADRVDDEAV